MSAESWCKIQMFGHHSITQLYQMPMTISIFNSSVTCFCSASFISGDRIQTMKPKWIFSIRLTIWSFPFIHLFQVKTYSNAICETCSLSATKSRNKTKILPLSTIKLKAKLIHSIFSLSFHLELFFPTRNQNARWLVADGWFYVCWARGVVIVLNSNNFLLQFCFFIFFRFVQ